MLARTKENILEDFQSLMNQFDQKIAELAQFSRQGVTSPNQTETNELNVLKLERMKIKQYYLNVHAMSEDQVLNVRPQLEEDYRVAQDTLSQPSKSMS